MIDDAARNGQSNATEPHSAGEDVVAVDGGNLPKPENLTSVDLRSFEAICRVSQHFDGSISFEFTLSDGLNSKLSFVAKELWNDCEKWLDKVERVERSLETPTIAIVLRPRLERLVKAANGMLEPGGERFSMVDARKRCEELEAALEPFLELVKE